MIFVELIEYASVFVASALNLNYGLGLSMTYDLSRFELFLLLSTGSIFGIAVCLLLGAKLREMFRRRFSSDQEGRGKKSVALQVWRRYGLTGLALLGGLIGPIPIVAIALLFSGFKKELIFLYLGAGKFVWSLAFAYLGYAHIQKVFAAIFVGL